MATESRAAQAMPLQSLQPADPTEPRTLADAMERTVPLLFGGFTRASPVRMVCFNVHTSPLWGAFFMLVNLASCAFIALMPEVRLRLARLAARTRRIQLAARPTSECIWRGRHAARVHPRAPALASVALSNRGGPSTPPHITPLPAVIARCFYPPYSHHPRAASRRAHGIIEYQASREGARKDQGWGGGEATISCRRAEEMRLQEQPATQSRRQSAWSIFFVGTNCTKCRQN
jgi:hypothetical protein